MIDCHINIWEEEHLLPLFEEELQKARASEVPTACSADDLHEAMKEVDKAIVFGLKYPHTLGVYVPDTTTIAAVEKYPDKFIGFACVDPHEKNALDTLKESTQQGGLKGVKMGPLYQNFNVRDDVVQPIFKYCQENNIPVTMHMGTSYVTRGVLNNGRPIHVDEIAMRYPELTLVLAHMGHPWYEECVAVVRKNPRVFGEISALGYRNFQFYQVMRCIEEYGIAHKVFWGSDYPAATVRESIDTLDKINDIIEGTKLPPFPNKSAIRFYTPIP